MQQTNASWPVKIKGNVTVCVHPSVHQMTSYVLLEQEDWFEDEMSFIRVFTTPDLEVFDIGANHGVYTLSIAGLLTTGHVWAFEPTLAPRSMLEASVALNRFSDRITVVPAGLSDHAGSALISTSLNSELNSLNEKTGACETIRLETLDGFIKTHRLEKPIGFVKLDAEGEEIKVIQGGDEFFTRQSPLVMFELKHGGAVNHGLIEAFTNRGYRIFRLLPDLDILVEYDQSYQDDTLNLFACKPERVCDLAKRGLLATEEDVARFRSVVSGLPENFWQEALGPFPFAGICKSEWQASDAPRTYLQALGACLKAHDRSLPPAERVGWLTLADSSIDEIINNPSGAHYAAWVLKVHLLHLLNRRSNCLHLCRQIISAFATATAPTWPFLPPRRDYFAMVPGTGIGEWLQDILQEFLETRRSYSSYFVPSALDDLAGLLTRKNHTPAIERRFVLAATRAGRLVQTPPDFPLFDPELSPNSPVWHAICGLGFSTVLLDDQTPIHIVDVGASSHGKLTEPYAPLIRLGLARVSGFEPNEEECRRLNALYANRRMYRYFPYFVGKGGAATFYETNWFMTGSLFKPNEKVLNQFEQLDSVVKLQTEHPTHTVSLEDLQEIEDIDMVKIDVQGAELDVFVGAGKKLDDVLLIWSEVEFLPLYENQPLFSEVEQFLRQRGFMFHAFDGIISRGFKPFCTLSGKQGGMRQAVWTDAVFVRHPDLWDHLPTLKLKKLAAILDSVTRSYDLCHKALQVIDQREASDLAIRYLQYRNSR